MNPYAVFLIVLLVIAVVTCGVLARFISDEIRRIDAQHPMRQEDA